MKITDNEPNGTTDKEVTTMTTTNIILNVFITNLGKYNEGELVGEWLELPATQEEIDNCLERIGINERYEEYFITDYESTYGFEVSEYESLTELNEQAQLLADLSDYDREIISVLMEEGGYDFGEALDELDNVMTFPECYDMTDVAEQYAEETGMLDSLPENLRHYFDFEKFGRDLQFDGNFMFSGGTAYVVWR